MAKSAGKCASHFFRRWSNPILPPPSSRRCSRRRQSRAYIPTAPSCRPCSISRRRSPRAEADVGIVPRSAAEAIAAACDACLYDIAALGEAAAPAGNVAIPLVKALTAKVNEKARGYVHWGATSQDVIDTAFMLVARRALAHHARGARDATEALAGLVAAHRGNDDARPHADAAGAADHLCLQGGRVAFGTDASPRRACGVSRRKRWPCSSAARPERSRRSARTGSPCAARSPPRSRPAGADDHLARRARQGLRHRCRARRPFRRVRQDCQRRPAHDADGGRRSVRAGRRRQGRLFSDAAQAQSRRRRRDPRQSSAHRRDDGDDDVMGWSRSTSAPPAAGPPSGRRCASFLPLRRQPREAARDARRSRDRRRPHAQQPRLDARPAARRKLDDGARAKDREGGAQSTGSRLPRSWRWPRARQLAEVAKGEPAIAGNCRPRRSTAALDPQNYLGSADVMIDATLEAAAREGRAK